MKLSGVHLLLTYSCNLECEHCFVWGSPWQEGAMKLSSVNEIIRQAVELGTVEWIYFEGGEPFLHYAVLLAGVAARRRPRVPCRDRVERVLGHGGRGWDRVPDAIRGSRRRSLDQQRSLPRWRGDLSTGGTTHALRPGSWASRPGPSRSRSRRRPTRPAPSANCRPGSRRCSTAGAPRRC